jgi:hypothetical protein
MSKSPYRVLLFPRCESNPVENPGLLREKKTVVKALIRRWFLTPDQSEFATVLTRAEEIFAQWLSMKKYWDEFCVPKMEKWANIHRRFHQVRTTNFLGSCPSAPPTYSFGINVVVEPMIVRVWRLLCIAGPTAECCLNCTYRNHGNGNKFQWLRQQPFWRHPHRTNQGIIARKNAWLHVRLRLLRRIGDVIRILLACDSSNSYPRMRSTSEGISDIVARVPLSMLAGSPKGVG